MIEPSPFFVLTWWVLLLASIAMMMREMIKWLSRRTASLNIWADAPRLETPAEEIEGTSRWLEVLSKDPAGRLAIGREVSEAVIDRVSLTLGLEKDDFRKLLHDGEFVRRTFGEHATVANYFSEDWALKSFSAKHTEKAVRKIGRAIAYLEEIKTILDQLGRWEKKYEGSRSI